MTNMKRITISIPKELDEKVLELRRTDSRFIRSSYSEIVRVLLCEGFKIEDTGVKEQDKEPA